MITSLPLAVLFAMAALFSLGELVWQRGKPEFTSYIADREAQATHLLMNGGMAGMFASLPAAPWAGALELVCGLAIAVLAARLGWLRGKRPPGRSAGTVFHILGLAAMIWSVQAMAHSMSPHRSWTAIVIAAAFALDGVATAVLVAFAPNQLARLALITSGAVGDCQVRTESVARALRVASLPHVVMDAGMVLMFWPLIRA